VLACCLDVQERYVYVTLNLRTLEQLQQHAGAFAVSLKGAEGRALRAKAADRSKQQQLQRRLTDLATQLNLTGRLDSNDEAYKAALGRVATQEVQRIQGLIEDTVSSLAAADAERRAAGAACKATQSIDKRMKKLRKAVQQYLTELKAWRLDPAAGYSSLVQGLPEQWTEQGVEEVCCGMYPWRGGDDNPDNNPALRRLGAQYRDALAEVGDGTGEN
jgi:hypothetical protein